MSSIQKSKRKNKKGEVIIKYHPVIYDNDTKKHIWQKGYATEEEAKIAEAKLIKKKQKGKLISSPSKKTVDQVACSWIEAIDGADADSTVKCYKYYYESYIKDIFGDKLINKITASHIQSYINLQKNKYKPEVVNKMITVFSNIFKFAILPLKLIDADDNPMIGIKRVKVPKKYVETWTREQTKYFLDLDIVKESHYYPMICISIIYGVRPGEVCGLGEANFSDKGFEICRGLNKYGTLTNLKNSRSHRFLPLIEELEWLHKAVKHFILHKKELRLAVPTYADHDFLFCEFDSGNPVKPNVLYTNFRRLILKNNELYETKLPVISLYALRHSFATQNLTEKTDPKAISEILGNDVKVLLSRYDHVTEGRRRETIKGSVSAII